MRAGRELDKMIAQHVMGHPVTQQKREVFEGTSKGTRPLAAYTTDMTAAWEVVERMSITLIPIENGGWFALAGKPERWKSPADFMQYLQTADFASAGAAVGESAPFVVCMAAIKAIENRNTAVKEGMAAIMSGTTTPTAH
jgi:hypothetical protein